MELEEAENIIGNKSKLYRKTIKEKKMRIKLKILKIVISNIILFIIFIFLYLIWLQLNIGEIEENPKINIKGNNQDIVEVNKINDIDENKDNIIEDKKEVIISHNITKEIIDFENSLRKIEKKEILEFRKTNSENILYDKIKYKRSENPDITIVLTMFNQAHCIHKALRSVQNQSLKNIEILILIDCSYDNSTETIQKYMEEDERIVMVNHDTIEGIMKIRSKGIKMARGKYITALDGDDAFIHKDILNNSLYLANMGNIDIVEFDASMYRNYTWRGFIHRHKNAEGIIYQPELRTKFFRINEEHEEYRPITCRIIWGKIVKNEIFKKAIDNIGSKYTDDYLWGFEDTMMTVSLYQVAESFYLMKQVGIYYSRDDKRGVYPFIKSKKCIIRENVIRGLDGLKFLNFLLEKLKNNEIERQTIYHEMISINSYDYSNYYLHVDHNYEMLYKVLDELFKSQYLTQKEKERIIQIKNQMKEKEEKSNNITKKIK